MSAAPPLRELGRADYADVYARMRDFTATRTPDTADEYWLVEHPPVYTLGQAADPSHVLAAGDIPVVPTDRGGQVTYHGPGQLVLYPLLDLRRRGIGPRGLVWGIEQALIDYLATLTIAAQRRAGAPGVYVGAAKIASIGLRVRKPGCYHGLALNLDMDLEPFARINPCGYAGLAMTQVAAHHPAPTIAAAGTALVARLEHWLQPGRAPAIGESAPAAAV